MYFLIMQSYEKVVLLPYILSFPCEFLGNDPGVLLYSG